MSIRQYRYNRSYSEEFPVKHYMQSFMNSEDIKQR